MQHVVTNWTLMPIIRVTMEEWESAHTEKSSSMNAENMATRQEKTLPTNTNDVNNFCFHLKLKQTVKKANRKTNSTTTN